MRRIRVICTVQEDVFRFMVTDGKGFRQNVWGKSKHKIQVQALLPISWLLRNNDGKYGTAREATDINMTPRMRTECWVPKATNTNRIYNIYCLFSATTATRLHYKNIAVIVVY